jgi:hypothetical protein
LIADPLNCTLRLNVIFHFFLTNFDFSLYTNKLKENLSVIIIGNVFSIGCSVHLSARPHRSSDAKPDWDTPIYMATSHGQPSDLIYINGCPDLFTSRDSATGLQLCILNHRYMQLPLRATISPVDSWLRISSCPEAHIDRPHLMGHRRIGRSKYSLSC